MITGKWELTLQAPMGEQKSILELKEDSGKLTGTQTGSEGEPLEIFDGTVNGDEFRYTVKLKKPMPMKIRAEGKVDGDTFSGEARMAMGKAGFTGVRIS